MTALWIGLGAWFLITFPLVLLVVGRRRSRDCKRPDPEVAP